MRPPGPENPWRLDPTVIQLNHGGYGACPTSALEAQSALRAAIEANATAFLDRELEDRLDAARAALAGFLDADAEALAFLPNATTGVSTVLASLRFRPGDELLTTDHEYNATLNALAAAARRDGARVVIARIPFPIRGAGAAIEAILAAVTPRTRLALISHVTSPTAVVLPITEIVAELERRGVDTLVDAAHAPGMVAVSLRELGAAYWTCNGHKWLCGPKGGAILAVREDKRPAIRPLVVSHGWNDPRPSRSAYRKEFDWLGTVDPTPYLALPTAIDTVGGLEAGGWPAVMAANRELALRGQASLAAALGIEPPVPAAMIGAMAALPLAAVPPTDDAALVLRNALAREHRIEVPIPTWPVPAARTAPDAAPAHALVRVSAQRYNDDGDIEALVAALARRGLNAG